MKKFLARIIVAVIMFPLIYIVLFVLHHFNFLALNIIILLFTIAGAFEVQNFYMKAYIPVLKYSAPILSASMAVITYIEITFFKEITSLTYKWLILIFLFIALRSILSVKKKDFSKVLPIISSSSFIIIYPGLLMTYIIRILTLSEDKPGHVFLFFIALVFSNEIMSYLSGKFLGQKTKLKLAISPNKTLVGFIVGFLSPIGVAVGFYYFVPQLFSTNLFSVMLFGSLISLTSIFGDLFESAMKRSANVKDSGTLMMGRGGILDTLDSLLLSAPVFFLVFPLISY
ncbi:MAG: phosphatidate cytidylyltransferase [Spirochaetales bacterium]|nr:phosphatidate cytidylyltransferase [Spirochaetales bacterium]